MDADGAGSIDLAAKAFSKTLFLREWLKVNPTAKETDLAAAWQAAGQSGKISASLFYYIKGEMGLNAPRKKRARRRAQRPGRWSRAYRSRLDGQAVSSAELAGLQSDSFPARQAPTMVDLEEDIDRLIFDVMAMGGLDEVESLLRRARRVLIRTHDH